ncbi:MAG: formylglycine-generating enzyme family protein [Kiritimatiellae bacterium]|nr:formylglycine-generating enzyme family protein [Kiritimatiellia bacterium]
MKKSIVMLAALSAGCAAYAATPSVSNVTLAQDPATRLVTVTYDLADADAIITLDVLTNGTASVGDANLTVLSGDVNRLVSQGSGKKIVWRPDAALASYAANATAVISAWTESNPPNYMAVNLSITNDLRYYTSAEALPYGGLSNDCYRKDILLMRRIPAKGVTWWMGQRTNEKGGSEYKARETRHQVTLTNDYWIGVFEFTYGQWRRMTSYPDGYFTNMWYRETRPVEKVSYKMLRGTSTYENWPTSSEVTNTCIIGRLRTHSGIATLDLPTDAQWEYACRAGTAEGLYSGFDISNTGNDPQASLLARHYQNGGQGASGLESMCDPSHGTAKVGSYLPNAWGLYDMLGNVYEWCLDRCASDAAIGAEAVTEPLGATTGTYRIKRGGSWRGDCHFTRAAYRGANKATDVEHSIGFRLAARIPNAEEE